MDNPILITVMRYLHIVSAIVAMGGMTFLIICLLPAVNRLSDELRQEVTQKAVDRFHRVLWVAIVGLVVSGFYAWILFNPQYNEVRPWGQALIGTKTLIAFVMFGLVAARSMGLIRFARPRTLPMINLHLAAIVVLLGTILRTLRM